jgi:predicted PurR-regulated permease PerM
MNTSSKQKQHRYFIISLFILALLLLLIVIKEFIIPILMAMLLAGLFHPYYQKFLVLTKGKQSLSSALVILMFLLVIVIPSFFMVAEIIHQASYVSGKIFPFIETQFLATEKTHNSLPKWIPFKEELVPYTEEIFSKLSTLVESITSIIISSLSSLTQGTLVFFFNFFVTLYAMHYFLTDGKNLLEKIPNYLPITHQEFRKITTQAVSISKATLKGAFLIGIIQGALVGVAFAVIGIPGAVFWGAVSALFSLIPSVGTAIVYVPVAVYLLITHQVTAGVGLLIWGFGIVSSVDNVLRPYFVGKDTQIPDILVLISTLGGIGLFGITGIIVGPVIVGLFMTIAKIYKASN